MAGGRLIIVSNRLPITVQETAGSLEVRTAPGGMAAALSSVWRKQNALWVGSPGIGRQLKREEFEGLQVGPNLAIMNLSTDLYHRYYDNFSNRSLWAVFHGFEPREPYSREDLDAYREVNDRFAYCLQQVVGPDDAIWVHDYQLTLLPGILRARGMRNRIGYFLHVPFPQGEWFAKLPDHIELASSIMQADVVGMQTERDVYNLRAYLKAFAVPGKAALHAFPVGIDYGLYHEAKVRPGVQLYLREILPRYEGKRVIFSASRQDYTKGILQQLQAARSLISESKGDVMYKIVLAPSREALSEYREVNEMAQQLAVETNAKYGSPGHTPVEFEHRNFGFDELLAWYIRADVMLVTPLIDGMNLIAKEYVAAHNNDGALVLGEHAGAAAQLRDALLVDPYDASDMAAAVHRALSLNPSERARRMQAMRDIVLREDVHHWAESFVRALWG
jgi:trehalose 6-phosphate synthase/phosphatase